jgi:hypothetical protein
LSLLRQFFTIGQDGLTVISLLAVAVQWPWLVVLLILTVVPSFVGETRFAAGVFALFQWTPERQQPTPEVCWRQRPSAEIQILAPGSSVLSGVVGPILPETSGWPCARWRRAPD